MVQMLIGPSKPLLTQIISNRVRIRTGHRQTIWLFTSMALGLLSTNPVGAVLELRTSIYLLARVLQAANNFSCNHNYNKIVKSDWLSTALISALIRQFNRTVRVMPK